MADSPFWTALQFRKPDPETELLDLLKQVPVFENLSNGGLKLIRHLCHQRIYKEGEHLFQVGDPGLGFYVVLEGKIEIYRTDGEHTTRFAVLSKGDFLGEPALIDDTIRSAAAKALTYSRVLGFFRPDLLGLIARKPRIGNAILLNISRILVKRLNATNQILEEKGVFYEHEGAVQS